MANQTAEAIARQIVERISQSRHLINMRRIIECDRLARETLAFFLPVLIEESAEEIDVAAVGSACTWLDVANAIAATVEPWAGKSSPGGLFQKKKRGGV